MHEAGSVLLVLPRRFSHRQNLVIGATSGYARSSVFVRTLITLSTGCESQVAVGIMGSRTHFYLPHVLGYSLLSLCESPG
jgi:hypothetical protein